MFFFFFSLCLHLNVFVIDAKSLKKNQDIDILEFSGTKLIQEHQYFEFKTYRYNTYALKSINIVVGDLFNIFKNEEAKFILFFNRITITLRSCHNQRNQHFFSFPMWPEFSEPTIVTIRLFLKIRGHQKKKKNTTITSTECFFFFFQQKLLFNACSSERVRTHGRNRLFVELHDDFFLFDPVFCFDTSVPRRILRQVATTWCTIITI